MGLAQMLWKRLVAWLFIYILFPCLNFASIPSIYIGKFHRAACACVRGESPLGSGVVLVLVLVPVPGSDPGLLLC